MIFGVQTLTLGALYYLAMLVVVAANIWAPQITFLDFSENIGFITFVAVFFSIYQTYLQLFKLKKWCSWCLFSTLLNLIIAGTGISMIASL